MRNIIPCFLNNMHIPSPFLAIFCKKSHVGTLFERDNQNNSLAFGVIFSFHIDCLKSNIVYKWRSITKPSCIWTRGWIFYQISSSSLVFSLITLLMSIWVYVYHSYANFPSILNWTTEFQTSYQGLVKLATQK